ncbi:hypothetical protein DNTS_016522 [Danionella cerebrum]|uniref:Heparan-sulfate 6-O-sulfotransferase n=1 Tax=Danionella cerebrum TaxID=2873325 RepID=A0A553MR68_9TELE|nr:hypothetical protein DNTS_016522 [Danionella translucida]
MEKPPAAAARRMGLMGSDMVPGLITRPCFTLDQVVDYINSNSRQFLTVLFVMIGYQYICPAGSASCRFGNGEGFPFSRYLGNVRKVFPKPEEDASFRFRSKFNFTRDDLERKVDFQIKGNDVIVFLHIQKTGGTTFGKHLVRNIHLERPCECRSGQKKCSCHRPGRAESWLFSRFSTGWSCGLHADWTELTSCVPAVMNKKPKKDATANRR